MAVTQAYSGTNTMTTTVYSMPNSSTVLTAITVAGAYQLFLDVSALTAADLYYVRCLEKATGSGDTQRTVWETHLTGIQPGGGWMSPTVMVLNGWDMQINKVSGTDRSIKFSIRKAG
jgi:hypothetical protein